MRALSTWFPSKNIYKETWKIPDTNNVNQINNILLPSRWASDLQIVRAHRALLGRVTYEAENSRCRWICWKCETIEF